jgi:O-antigen ligase
MFCYYNYLLDRYTLNDLTRLMVWAYGLLLTLSVFVSLAVPSIGIDDGSSDPNNRGAWQGVFIQKNQLGGGAAIGMAVALGLRPKNSVDRLWRYLLIVTALICAKGSQSRECWIAIAIEFAFLGFMRILRRLHPKSRLPAVVVGMLGYATVGILTYIYADDILKFLGRTRSASGRTGIWDGCILLIQRHPWLGYGTYGVWNTPRAWDVVARVGWLVSSSHNNYLEILLSYGIVGLLLYLPIIFSSFLYIFRALLNYDLRGLEVPIYVVIAILVLSMAVPLIMYSPSVGLVLLLYVVSRLEQVERSGFMTIRP